MKLYFICFSIAAFVACVANGAAAQTTNAAPEPSASAESVDAGQMPDGQDGTEAQSEDNAGSSADPTGSEVEGNDRTIEPNSSTGPDPVGEATASVAAIPDPLPAPIQTPHPSVPRPESLGSGSFEHRVNVEVPEFFGIEPNLAIVYNSGQRLRYTGASFGLLGAGARISGLSVIDRARPHRGAPAFAASDIFLLNGQEMVSCASAAQSPSCSNGGNYATRVESYNKVKFFDPGNYWEITNRSGTIYRYRPVSFFFDGSPSNSDEQRLASDYR